MEQKKILWITFIVGLFLLIVTGIAYVLYRTADSQNTARASVQLPNDVWVRPVPQSETAQSSSPAAEKAEDVKNVSADTLSVDSIQADSITVKTLDVRSITGADPLIPDTAQKQPVIETTVEQKSKPAEEKKSVASPAKKTVSVRKPVAPRAEKKQSAPKEKADVYWIQAVAFTDKLKAEDARTELGKRLITPHIFTKDQNGVTYYRVRVGPYTTQKEAEYWHIQLQSIKGFEQSYITRTAGTK